MRHITLLTVLLAALLCPACIHLSFDAHEDSGSYTEDHLSVRWDLRRNKERGEVRLVDVRFDERAPVAKVEIVVEADGEIIEVREAVMRADGGHARIRGLEVTVVSRFGVRVLGHPADGGAPYAIVAASIGR